MANIRFTNKQLNELLNHIFLGNVYYHRSGKEFKLPDEKDMLWKIYSHNGKDYLISNCMVIYVLDTRKIPKMSFNSDKPILKTLDGERLLSDIVNELFGKDSRVREFRLNEFNHLRKEL